MFDTADQTSGDVLLQPLLDERSRQTFAKHLRQFVFSSARGAAHQAYEQRVAPALAAASPADARDRNKVRAALLEQPEYQFFSDLHRISQEQIWSSTADTVEREAPRLLQEFRQIDKAEGSLQLHPELEIPRYLRAMDTHCMPGSYHTEWTDGDLANGALYDRGGFLYSPGGGPRSDGAGRASLAFLQAKRPDFKPRRILDLGCGTGSPMLPFAEAFPAAELHGVDVGAPLLRFGHLRAEKPGVPMHLRQADAAATGYPDGHFDLITSHIMFHETSAAAVPKILAESFRLLAAGGALVVLDLPNAAFIPDVFQQIVFDGDAHYNNEHFWMRMHDLDWGQQLQLAGFAKEAIEIGFAPMQIYAPPSSANPQADWKSGRFGLFALLATKPGEPA